jgi:hypothetical protein
LIYHRDPAVRWRSMEAGDGVAGGGLDWPSPGWSPVWGSDLNKGGGPRASLA